MVDDNKNKKQKNAEQKDVPVTIDGEKVPTDPNVVRTIELGKEDKKTTEKIKKGTIKKAED